MLTRQSTFNQVFVSSYSSLLPALSLSPAPATSHNRMFSQGKHPYLFIFKYPVYSPRMLLFSSEDAGRVSACRGRPTVPFISAFHLLFRPTNESAARSFTSSLSGLLPIIIVPVITAPLSLLHTHTLNFLLVIHTTVFSKREQNQGVVN